MASVDLWYNFSGLVVQCLAWRNEGSRDVKFCMQSLIVAAGLVLGLPLFGAVTVVNIVQPPIITTDKQRK